MICAMCGKEQPKEDGWPITMKGWRLTGGEWYCPDCKMNRESWQVYVSKGQSSEPSTTEQDTYGT